jgi:hypothetical protein
MSRQGSAYYIPSYLERSDGNANFKSFADSMPHVGPLRFRDVSAYYTPTKKDIDWVLRFQDTGFVNVAPDADLSSDRIPEGSQIAIFNASEGRVVVSAGTGVTVASGDSSRFVVDKWKVGILVKTGANFWLLSLGNGSGGGNASVPLPPVLTACYGVSGGVSLVWNRPSDDGGSPVVQYLVEGSVDGTTWTTAGFTTPMELSFTVNDLLPGTTYSFRVKALNSVGVSDPSNVLAASPSTDFNVASGGQETIVDRGGRRFKVHTFLTSGTLSVDKSVAPFTVAVVGSGGSGGGGFIGAAGYAGGDGGGGGGWETALTIPVGDLAITVGAGGAASVYNGGGQSGGLTTALTVTVGSGGGGQSGQSIQDSGKNPTPGTKGNQGGTSDGGNGSVPTFPGQAIRDKYQLGSAGNGGGGGGQDGPGGGSAGQPGAVVIEYEVALYNEATGGDEVAEYSDGTGDRWRYHKFVQNGTLTVTNAASPFRVFLQGGGAGGGYRQGGGRGAVNDTDVTLLAQPYQITVGAGVSGGYDEYTNRDAPGNNGNRSAIEGVISSPGGISRGDYYAAGATTNITGTPVTYGGAGGSCVINEGRNEGGFPGGGLGGSTGSAASTVGGGGGGCQWVSGGGARGEVIVAYRIKNPVGFQKATEDRLAEMEGK